MRRITALFTTITTIIIVALSACTRVVGDEPVGAWSFTAVAEQVREGNDIPIHLMFKDAGLVVDNPSWGDKWKGASFYGEVYDVMGRQVENAVFSGPGGVLGKGCTVDINPNGRLDIILGALREGVYTVKMNLETRYTVDTWATTTVTVLEKGEVGPVVPPEDIIPVEDFTVPGKDNGLEIDEIGNIILDLRFFNEMNPFRYNSTVTPENATNKQLLAQSENDGVAGIQVEGQTLLVITPKVIGTCVMVVRSEDGNAMRSFGVRVIRSLPDATGFTLPIDDGERDAYEFDLAGRLALDVNKYNDSNPFGYTCRPIPAEAAKPSLTASSSDNGILVASIQDGNRLVLKPVSPGYVVVTVSTTDGAIVRTMKVVVYSAFQVVLDAVESAASEEDKVSGIFPCKITMKADSQHLPKMMQLEVYGKATGRIDLTDPVDYFKADSLKNARTAYFSFAEKVPVLYLANGNSAYDIYTRLLKKVGSMGAVVHHAADWPGYYDYVAYYRFYKLDLSISVKGDFDTNLYRVTLVRKYDSPTYRIYQYLF